MIHLMVLPFLEEKVVNFVSHWSFRFLFILSIYIFAFNYVAYKILKFVQRKRKNSENLESQESIKTKVCCFVTASRLNAKNMQG